MPSTYTTSLKLTLPATGELAGTWGTTVNTGITSLVDDAVAGTAAITVGGSDYTLSNTDGAANEARKMFITATGSPGAARNVIVPAVSKLYFVFNNTTGGFALTFKTLAGTGISVANGARMVLYCDGTNVVNALNAITLASPLPAASGGTGQSSYTAGDLLYATGATALSKLGVGTADQVLTSSGTAPQWSSGLTLTTLTASGTVSFTGGTVTLGSSTAATTIGLGSGATISGSTKTINIGTAGVSGSTTNINIGSAVAGSTTTVTLNAGTASGVAYLNGSKALTTGTALTFDGATLAVTGDANGDALNLNSSGNTYIQFQRSASNTAYVQSAAAAFYLWNQENTPTLFGTNNTERMRLDSSGNLGVGTSSPAQIIDAVRTHNAGTSVTVRNASTGASATTAFIANADTATGRFTVFSSGAGSGLANALSIEQSTNNPILFYLNSAEKVRITGAGDVGIGTNAPSQKLDVNGSVQLQATGTLYLNNVDNTNQYYFQNIGGSGANNAVLTLSRTNAGETLRVDASGNLGIGTAGQTARGNIDISSAGLGGSQTRTLHFGYSAVDFYGWRIANTNNAANTAAGTLSFQRGTTLAWADAVTLTDSGNLGVGTTSPSYKLDVRDSTAGVIRAFTTSTGNAGLVAQTAAGGTAYLELTTNAGSHYIYGGAGGTQNLSFVVGSERARIDTNGYLLVGYTTSNGSYNLQVNSQIYATNATIATSDGRYKEDVQPVENALDTVAKLRPVSFKWKPHEVHNFPVGQTDVGFIAQEVQTALDGSAYADQIVKANTCTLPSGEEETFLGLADSKLIPVLVKAIQEQQSLIEDLRARVAALEAQ